MQTNTCRFCEAPMKISQRTGKPYCSALCWKNKTESSESQTGDYVKQLDFEIKLQEIRNAYKALDDRIKKLENEEPVEYPEIPFN